MIVQVNYLGRVIEFSAPDFIRRFAGQSLAQIANRAFMRLLRSFDFLIAARVLWVMIQVVGALN